MAKEVPQELKTFKEKVEGKTGKMTSTTSDIASKISDLSTVVTSVKSRVSSAYQSSTEVNTAVTKLDNTNELINNIKSDVESTLNGAIGEAEAIVSNTTTLLEYEAKIKANESAISTENKKEEPNSGRIASLRSENRELESKFDELVSETQAKLVALKGKDSSLQKAEEASGSDSANKLDSYSYDLANLKYGSFITDTFVSSKGVEVPYHLYIPDYGTDVTGLPVFMYIHGGRKQNNYQGSWNNGITKMIEDKTVTPSGIVISPFCKNFDNEGTFEALKELTDQVVSKYKCDTDRISIGGASYGAITAYQMVNHYPDYYAACVPVAGYDTVTDAFKDVAVWALHGTRDLGQGRTNYNVTVQRVDEINKVGGSAYLTPLKGLGHSNIHNKVYQNKFTTPDGDQDTPLEWAFKQSKSKNKAKKNGNTKTA